MVPQNGSLVSAKVVRHHEQVNESEALEAIGKLIKKARLQKGFSQKPFATFSGVDTKTLASMERGTRVAWEINQNKVEEALGWRYGAIKDVLDSADHTPVESVTLETMQEGGGEVSWKILDSQVSSGGGEPVRRAYLLTDEELISELSYRFNNYRTRINRENPVPE